MITPRFTTLAIAATALFASAQTNTSDTLVIEIFPEAQQTESLIDNTQLLYFGEGEVGDSTKYRNLINQFYEDQFRHSQDPRAPYFMLMSRNGNLAMGIGGELKMIGSYDWHGALSGTSFVPYKLPSSIDPTARQMMQMTPSRTSVFLSAFGNSKHFGAFQIYIEGKFSGSDHTFKLGKAYATVGDWTLGYTKSTFDDPIAQPATIDTEGANSEIDDSRLLVRYMHNINKKFSVAMSIEAPDVNIATTSNFTPITYRVPDIGAFFQYSYAKQHIRLSAIMKNMGYRNLVAQENHNVLGWGVNLSAKIHVTPSFLIYAAGNTGYGIGNMVNDLSYGDNDLLGYASEPGKMYAPQSYGWYGALQYYFSPKVFSTLIFSQERILPKADSEYTGDNYKYGQYATANVFWNVAPRVQIGAEFNAGRRVNMDDTTGKGYRAALMAEFSF